MTPQQITRRRALIAAGGIGAAALYFLQEQTEPATPHVLLADGKAYPTGYQADPPATAAFVQALPQGERTFAEAGRRCFADLKADKPILLYRAMLAQYRAKFGGDWVVGAQGIGDCVSWGWAHGAQIHHAVLCEGGEASDWDVAATEAIYGGSRVEALGRSRGGWGDGSYGAAAAAWLTKWGVVYRQNYEGVADLREYSARRAKDWGNYGCGGEADSGKLDEIAKRHACGKVALVTTFAEAAAAISNGYPVPVCSGQGFSSHRDEQGFSRPQGSWSHCMCFIGVRYDRPGLLCLNSWGPSWVGGAKWPPEDMPEGSFWVDQRTAEAMLRGRDSFAVAGLEGFVRRRIDHAAWV